MIRQWAVPEPPLTHLLMDGGRLFVSDEEMDSFYDTYVTELSERNLYAVEQKTETFRFFVDLDYKAADKLADADLLDIVTVMNGCVGGGRCCIARATARPVKEGIKSGVHIHWPDKVVTRGSAMQLRTKILEHFEGDVWADRIDSSVYNGSGLRMLWSHKKPTGDPYKPWRMLDGHVFGPEKKKSVLELFTIRCPMGTFSPRAGPSVDANLIEEFIQKYVRGHETTSVKRISELPDNAGYFVQTDSKWCERIRGTHRSNHVWFMITPRGRLVQRCFNDDCKDHANSIYRLPPSCLEDINITGSPPKQSFFRDPNHDEIVANNTKSNESWNNLNN